jgi:hypothetical protein
MLDANQTTRPAALYDGANQMTQALKETIMGQLLLAAALFLATMSITASMAAATGPVAQSAPGAITQYQDPN